MATDSIGTCAVVCPQHHGIVAREFLEIVAQHFVDLKVNWHSGSLSDDRSDVLVPVVSPADLPETHRQLVNLRAIRPHVRVLPLTVQLSHSEIASLVRAGAWDFLKVPFEPDECVSRVQRLLDDPRGCPGTPIRSRPSSGLSTLVGASPPFRHILDLLPKVAGCDSNALLLGETGTGKEVVARAIHYCSSRAAGPWVAVDCGAIPSQLIESELFGHVQGAFTNAHQSRTGLVQEAEGGTLLLDEIDALPLTAQAKLLRFIQEKEYRRVGSNRVVHADVRIIAASNRSLLGLVDQGRFRRDLLFRLNVIEIQLPALRERPEDIPLLACHFAKLIPERSGRAPLKISEAALAQLASHSWPGNVRELRHTIERAVWMAGSGSDRIEHFDLLNGSMSGAATPCPGTGTFCAEKSRVVEAFERNYINRVLAACAGNITQAARLAGKNRRAFFALLQKHKIDSDAYRGKKALGLD